MNLEARKTRNTSPLAGMRADRARGDTMTFVLALIGWGSYVLAAALAAIVVAMVIHNSNVSASVADGIVSEYESWPAADKQRLYETAAAYNDSLKGSHTGRIPADAKGSDGVAKETLDGAYMSAMNVDGNGGIARLRIPKISVSVPVMHTTLDDVLDTAAGHMYGTALPIGRDGDFTAIGAHSGGVQGMLFTRLPQLNLGDSFYLDVLDGEHGYLVSDIRTVLPENIEQELMDIREHVDPTKPRVTLVTCVPIGISSHRLLVTGVRGSIPEPVPPSYEQKDMTMIAIGVGIGIFVLLLALAVVVKLILRKKKTLERKDTTQER